MQGFGGGGGAFPMATGVNGPGTFFSSSSVTSFSSSGNGRTVQYSKSSSTKAGPNGVCIVEYCVGYKWHFCCIVPISMV